VDQERTTKELMEELGRDIDRCHAELIATIDAGQPDGAGNIDADYEFHARQLVRATFAYIEATTFSVKASSAARCMDAGIYLTPEERYFSTDTEFELNERGEIVETVAKISLSRNVRFALAMLRKAHGVSAPFDASGEWWSCFKEAIRVRDRLTHPKMPGDLEVTGNDILNLLKARQGFEQEILSHGSSNVA
jgi:hypothetical protein